MKFFQASSVILCMLLLNFALGSGVPTHASEIFKYTDSDGMVHYVDSKKKVPEEYQEQLSSQESLPAISKVSPGRDKLYEKTHYTPVVKKAGVELFVTDWCGYCRKLEEYLDQEKIAYTRYNIETDKSAKKLHASLGSGVPITRVGKRVFQGYQPEEIAQAARGQ